MERDILTMTPRQILTNCQAALDQSRADLSRLNELPRWRWLARLRLAAKIDASQDAAVRWLLRYEKWKTVA